MAPGGNRAGAGAGHRPDCKMIKHPVSLFRAFGCLSVSAGPLNED